MQPQISGKDLHRILRLEQRVDRLASVVDLLSVRNAGSNNQRHVRSAVTADDGNYPASGNSFPIVFTDPSYGGASGATGFSRSPRQSSPKAVCYNIAEEYIPVGIPLFVWRENGEWWTYRCCKVEGCQTPCGVPVSVTATVTGIGGPYAGGTDCITHDRLNDVYGGSLTEDETIPCKYSFVINKSITNQVACHHSNFQVPGDDNYNTTLVVINGTIEWDETNSLFKGNFGYVARAIDNPEAPLEEHDFGTGIWSGDIDANAGGFSCDAVEWVQSMSSWFELDSGNHWSVNDSAAQITIKLNFA